MNIVSLPSTRHLQNMTANLKTLGRLDENDMRYIRYVLSSLPDDRKICNLVIDEVKLSPSLQYNSGQVTGYSVSENELATSMLGIMISPLFMKSIFMLRLIPCSSLNSSMLVTYVRSTVEYLESLGFQISAIISDNHRINQSMVKSLTGKSFGPEASIFKAMSGHPVRILIDPVHLLKTIRNNWMKALLFTFPHPDTGVKMKAIFADVKHVYDHESSSLLRISHGLNRKSVRPNDIEKQQVR